MELTERFTVEHGVFLKQLSLLEQLLRGEACQGRLTTAIDVIRGPLEAHAAEEEQQLFPRLEPHFGREEGPLAVMYKDHSAIRGLINRILLSQARQEIIEPARQFVELLRRHIAWEDEVFFPMARSILSLQPVD